LGENYTLGYGREAVRFLDRRTLATHGAFIEACLLPGLRVLDCGCGPGGITQGIAARVAPGRVVGVDMDESQIVLAAERAASAGLDNVEFRQGSVYELPFADDSFDAVFSHALFEHLADKVRAARECLRVLRPGGVIGVCTPDWGGFVVTPDSPAVRAAVAAYEYNQNRNGGDTRTGRKLAEVLTEAGFVHAKLTARYENYSPLSAIGNLLAWQLERDGMPEHGATLRRWQEDPQALFAQAWLSCVARKAI
jgi:ubiquinone/menaquinone biosynthesis C-methylase UbiE